MSKPTADEVINAIDKYFFKRRIFLFGPWVLIAVQCVLNALVNSPFLMLYPLFVIGFLLTSGWFQYKAEQVYKKKLQEFENV